jgi:alpha-beta hydrolase superfamily lysophospholipase
MHAYKFTHFSDTLNIRTDPKNLSLTDKISVIFTGIQNPRQQDLTLPKSDFEVFYIESDKRLESWFMPIGNPKGLILLYHGYAGDKSQMLSRAEGLNRMGFSTAIIGFRGSGKSEGNYTTIGYEESKDVISSYNFYENKYPEQPIFLYGTSMGAATILKAISEEELSTSGIILEYPFGSLHQSVKNRFKVVGFPSFPMANILTLFGGWQLDYNAFEHNPSDYALKVRCPTLYLAGDNDDRVTKDETRQVFQNLKTEDKSLHIFEGGGHENFNETFTRDWIRICDKFLTPRASSEDSEIQTANI